MGFPFETATWEGASGPIFMGAGTSAPGIYTVIAIVLCVAALILGQKAEAEKYAAHN